MPARGTAIANVFWIKSACGNRFKVGCDCVEKTGDAGLKRVINAKVAEHRTAIEDSIARSVKALPLLLDGEMEKAMALIHTSKPPRPKPPKPPKVVPAEPDTEA